MSDNTPKQGDRMAEEVLDGEGKVLYRAIHEVVEAPEPHLFRSARDTAGEAAPQAALKTVLQEEEWFDDDFRALQEDAGEGKDGGAALRASKESGGAGDTVKTALEVAKFAWQFIKDNKPVVEIATASTSVLAKGTEPLSYHSARQGSSGIFQYRGWNWPDPNWTAWDIKTELAGTFAGRPPEDVANGYYLPSVYFNVPECFVGWPHSASADAQVTNPSNIGGPNDVNAMCEVLAKINVSNVIENFTKTFKFTAVGRSGFSR